MKKKKKNMHSYKITQKITERRGSEEAEDTGLALGLGMPLKGRRARARLGAGRKQRRRRRRALRWRARMVASVGSARASGRRGLQHAHLLWAGGGARCVAAAGLTPAAGATCALACATLPRNRRAISAKRGSEGGWASPTAE